jgi:amino acid adenylation domain-containing protein
MSSPPAASCSFPDLLLGGAARTPDARAIVDATGVATHGEVDTASRIVAHRLIDAGVAPGDRVVLALENSRWFVIAYLGVMRAGAVAVPLAPGQRSDRIGLAVADCTPKAAILDQPTHGAMASLLAASQVPVVLTTTALENLVRTAAPATGAELRTRAGGADLAAIIYTSGSTGAPRGVMLSHANLMANTRSILDYLPIAATDRAMLVLPLFYVYGLSVLHTHLAAGAAVVLDNRFAFPNAVLAAMQQHAITSFAGVPSTYAILLDRSAIRRTPLPSLRYVTQAGGAMPPARVREWLEAVPGVPLFLMYGATEAGARLAYLDPAELPRRMGSIGRAIPGVELQVVRDDGTPARAGEVGELVARGANIARGYWGQPEETAQAFAGGTYRTGDLAFADADGFLFLVGRRKEFLKVGAHRVGPWEIEHALAEHPAVADVAVVGVPHDLLGEAPVACLVPREGHTLDESDVMRWCRGRLPEYKVPIRLLVRTNLPRTASGKLDRPALADAVRPALAPAC